MRAREFVTENATAVSTCSGSIAPVIQPIGTVISRTGDNFFSGTKYSNSADPYPNTPAYMKKGKSRRAGR
jgi:hypothetical protein